MKESPAEYFATNWPWILGGMLVVALLSVGISCIIEDIRFRMERRRRYRRTGR